MKDCVFCKIVDSKIPSFKVWEDGEFLAILDINPNCEGQTLVISKKHFPAYLFKIPEKDYQKMTLAARKVALLLEKTLAVKRVALVLEGMGINHAHIKLYPLYGLKSEFGAGEAKKAVFFKKYPGFVTSQLGPQENFNKLKSLTEKIRKNS